MPQAVVTWLMSYGLSQFTAQMVVAFAMSYAANAIIGAIFKPETPSFKSEAMGRTQMVKSSVAPRNFVYGDVMISGPLVFASTSHKYGGEESFEHDRAGWQQNRYLHLIIALASHEIEAIDEIWLNDSKVGPLDSNGYVIAGEFYKNRNNTVTQTYEVQPNLVNPSLALSSIPSRVVSVTSAGESLSYSVVGNDVFIPESGSFRKVTVVWETLDADSLVRVKKYLGTASQLADPDLRAELSSLWTSAHRLRGIAYVYIRLEYNRDVFPFGIPNVKCRVRGKKVFDPRLNDGIRRYSNNFALCAYDYLIDNEGFSCDSTDIDIESVKNAARISDEYVRTSSGNERRYRVNGVLTTDKTPDDNIRALLSAAGGSINLSGGLLKLHAASYDPPVLSLGESDLRGPIKVQPRTPRRDLFNAVRGTYVDGEGSGPSWVPIDFPIQSNSLYEEQDNEYIAKDVDFPMTTSSSMAQRLAKMLLERSRQGIVVEFPAKMTAFRFQVWDTVMLNLPKFGWSKKVFRIVEWKFSPSGGIDMVLREESPGAYEWNLGRETRRDDAPDTNLPRPGYVPNMGPITLDSGGENLLKLSDGTIISRIKASWPVTTSIQIEGSGFVELEYRTINTEDDSTGRWIRMPRFPGSSSSAMIGPVLDQVTYIVRGRFVGRRGNASLKWTYSLPHNVEGKTAKPANVPWFTIEGNQLSWGEVTEDDLAGYRIKFHYGYNRSWDTASLLHDGLIIDTPYTPIRKPQGQLTLMIKAVDTSGNESDQATYLSNAFGDALVANVVESFDMRARGFAANFIDE